MDFNNDHKSWVSTLYAASLRSKKQEEDVRRPGEENVSSRGDLFSGAYLPEDFEREASRLFSTD